jgi:predicted MPP superfamily phosphohydrolase
MATAHLHCHLSMNRKNFLATIGLTAASGLITEIQAKIPTATVPKRKRVLRVAHLTDIHVHNEKISMKGFEKALCAVNDLKDKVDFIVNGGDAIMNAVALSKSKVKSQWSAFHSVLNHNNSLPIHHCIGNHDLFGWAIPGTNKDDGKLWACEEYQMNKKYYSIKKDNWKMIVLDSIHMRNTIPGYYGKLDDEQLGWLQSELTNTNKNDFIFVVSHIPIISICSMFDNIKHDKNNWFVPDNALHADSHILKDLFHLNGNVKACLSGHIHLIDHVNYLGTDYYCNGAVSGGWWKGEYQQFPPAFIVMNFYDDGTSEREIYHYQWN